MNEWHFAKNCLELISEQGRAVFSIVRRDKHPKFAFAGILRDRKGNVYEIGDSESKSLFDTLLVVHELEVEEDHTHTELIITHKS